MKIAALKDVGGLALRYRMAFVMGVVIIIVGGVVLAKDKKKSVESATHRLVRSYTVLSAQGSAAEYTGTIHARTESNLGFRVPGKIIERIVKAGDHVKRGQVLMRLDPTDLRLAATAAQAAVEAARAQNKRALADELRQRDLVAKKAVSVQEYEQAKSLADATTAQLNSAVAYSRQVENQEGYAVLKADADGVIMEIPAEVGQVVAAGSVVIRLAHNGAREAVVNLPEGYVKSANSTATGCLYAEPGRRFPAKLRELSAMADPLTRTYQARYSLGDVGAHAPLGATVTIHLDGERTQSAVQQYEIPVGALYDGGTGTSVWVVNPATSSVSRRMVVVAKLGSETALISKGLKAGEQILALGAHLVKEGEKVKILSSPAKEQK
ncbi:RND family efflux transporter, MFP subunit [Trichlorobacter thiogenes]|uniref:RND family efflux transporter, MFP subunit n=1 Tax=Trichlorobacter thiogenes TaxID=115783 RepID=A0A1T4KDI7_9BACT|nr:efflux RND transporter periplasmic adaptor subunit [Trichlorobacter thiogenes]SJZ40403.1 RND family efflux transporter, MFP subunit [Trichlorobacter thiogenes]